MFDLFFNIHDNINSYPLPKDSSVSCLVQKRHLVIINRLRTYRRRREHIIKFVCSYYLRQNYILFIVTASYWKHDFVVQRRICLCYLIRFFLVGGYFNEKYKLYIIRNTSLYCDIQRIIHYVFISNITVKKKKVRPIIIKPLPLQVSDCLKIAILIDFKYFIAWFLFSLFNYEII